MQKYLFCFRLIKLASTKLNFLIGIGAIILYVDTFFFVIPTTNPNVVNGFCNLTTWLTAIGYSLCYGTILAKMARVYYIFDNPSTTKKAKVCVANRCMMGNPVKYCLLCVVHQGQVSDFGCGVLGCH